MAKNSHHSVIYMCKNNSTQSHLYSELYNPIDKRVKMNKQTIISIKIIFMQHNKIKTFISQK